MINHYLFIESFLSFSHCDIMSYWFFFCLSRYFSLLLCQYRVFQSVIRPGVSQGLIIGPLSFLLHILSLDNLLHIFVAVNSYIQITYKFASMTQSSELQKQIGPTPSLRKGIPNSFCPKTNLNSLAHCFLLVKDRIYHSTIQKPNCIQGLISSPFLQYSQSFIKSYLFYLLNISQIHLLLCISTATTLVQLTVISYFSLCSDVLTGSPLIYSNPVLIHYVYCSHIALFIIQI